jgi:hypothetical protein
MVDLLGKTEFLLTGDRVEPVEKQSGYPTKSRLPIIWEQRKARITAPQERIRVQRNAVSSAACPTSP